MTRARRMVLCLCAAVSGAVVVGSLVRCVLYGTDLSALPMAITAGGSAAFLLLTNRR